MANTIYLYSLDLEALKPYCNEVLKYKNECKTTMNKEEQLLSKRISELADLCYQRDIPTHTDFLNLNEQTIFHRLVKTLPRLNWQLAGGYALAERKVVCFLPSYEEALSSLPFSCLKIEPVQARFAQEVCHRDYLGALINLGIDRGKMGDILVQGKSAWVFCMEELADYIIRELTFVKHNHVSVSRDTNPQTVIEPDFETLEGSVASLRLDCVLSLAFGLSRSKAAPYLAGEKVFVNGRLETSASLQLRDGDIVSLRGMGRFLYQGLVAETKKGRLLIRIHKYR